MGCATEKEFENKFNFEHGGRILTYIDFIKQQKPFAKNKDLQEYIRPKNGKNLVTQNFDRIYVHELTLRQGILAGMQQIDLFKDTFLINLVFGYISNNTKENLDKIHHLFGGLISKDNLFGIQRGAIDKAKPYFSYLVSGIQKMFGINLNLQKQGILFIYSGDRDTDVEFAFNAAKASILYFMMCLI